MQSEDVKREISETGSVIDARARITNIAPAQDARDAVSKGEIDQIAIDAGFLKIVNDEIDAMSARMINLANANMTIQGDAINVGTLTAQFPALMSIDSVGVDTVTISIDTLTLGAVQGVVGDIQDALNALQTALETNHVLTIN